MSSLATACPPALRAALVFEAVEDAGSDEVIVRDPMTRNSHRLNAIATAIARRLDGERTLAELRLEVEAQCETTLTLDEIAKFVFDLDARHLLDTPESAQHIERLRVEKVERARLAMGMFDAHFGDLTAFPPEAIEVREDLRYACQGCGVCCSGRFRVELSPTDEATLRALDLSDLGRTIDDVIDEETLVEAGKKPRRYLRREEGHCVFLAKDGLCDLHRHHGYENKPLGCRLFPFTPLRTPRGGVIQFRPECSTQHRSRRTGPPVATRKMELWREMAEGFRTVPSVPERFMMRVGAGPVMTYDEYVEREAAWSACVRDSGWRVALTQIARDLFDPQPSLAISSRQLQSVLVALFEQLEEGLEVEEGQAGRRSRFFETLIPGGLGQAPLLMPTLLQSVGVIRPRDMSRVVEVVTLAQEARSWVEAMEAPEIDAIFDDYILTFLSGKMAFSGVSLTSGLGLMSLIMIGARRTACYLAATGDQALSEDLVNETLVNWHLEFFSQSSVRTFVLSRCLEALEGLTALPHEIYW